MFSLSDFQDGKVVSPAPPLPPGNIPDTYFFWKLNRLQDHSAAGRIMSMENSNDTIENPTLHLPPPHAPYSPCKCVGK